MKRIRLINIIPDFPVFRQLPSGFEAGRDCRFFFGPGESADGSPAERPEPEDYLVCYDELKVRVATRVPRERRLLIIGEPPCITRYPAEYLNLFGTLICPYDFPKFRGRHIRTSPALWWFYGMHYKDRAAPALTWDEMAALPVPEKTGLVSTVCSDKAYCARHAERRRFAARLQHRLPPGMLAVYGHGGLPAPDKRLAIDPCKYHIVVENNDVPGFWTEKLADAFLGYALPLYVGGPGVEADFPAGSMIRLDIRDAKASARLIEQCVRENLWEQRLPQIKQARDLVLRQYNTFARILDALEGMPGPQAAPALAEAESLPLFNETRQPYHFREHLNHQAIKHLPLRGPIFKI